MTARCPDPNERPTIPLWPDTGRILGLGKATTYAAARTGAIPTLRFGARLVVPTAKLRMMLSLDTENDEGLGTTPGLANSSIATADDATKHT
jgi:hypothetical protein